jgi:regulator of RNase E activity RraA
VPVTARSLETQALRTRFEALYCGVVYDALRFDLAHPQPFVVDMAIKPAFRTPAVPVLFGHAFTCKGRLVQQQADIDDTVRIAMFREFTAGCVQVIDTGGDQTVAHFGDISARIARKFGAAGAVIDGNARDLRFIEQLGFPLWVRGVQPVDAYGKWQIVEYQGAITLKGIQGPVTVLPGDYIFADPDGVLVIPYALAEEASSAAEVRLARENLIREQVAVEDDIQSLNDKIGRW